MIGKESGRARNKHWFVINLPEIQMIRYQKGLILSELIVFIDSLFDFWEIDFMFDIK